MAAEFKTEIQRLRLACKPLLTSNYDTDYNLLRWCQGYGFNIAEATKFLIRHLKFRRFFDLDHAIENVSEEIIAKEYFPLGLVGSTGLDNRFIVIECAGKIDLEGLLNSIQMTQFILQRLKFQEKMLNVLNEHEALTGQQSSVVYILDLEGLQFNKSLLNVVTGQYRMLWAIVYTNYPEWISVFFIINAPSFMPILWKAIAPLIPEHTRNKVRIFSSKKEQDAELMRHCDPDFLPKHWGGVLVDKNGDPKCRDRLIIPEQKIPKDLYWKPDKESPHWGELDAIVLGPGSTVVKYYKVESTEPTYFILNLYTERIYSIGVYYSKDPNQKDFSKMEEWYPEAEYPGMPTVDYVRVRTLGPGIYCMKLSNENSWFRSLSIYYRVRFTDRNNAPISFNCE